LASHPAEHIAALPTTLRELGLAMIAQSISIADQLLSSMTGIFSRKIIEAK
jgi:hypothetical protein